MRILLCWIGYMDYYKGSCDKDIPRNCGPFIKENGYGGEEFNFLPIIIGDEEFCFGFVEPKSTNKETVNTIHIEKIEGCENLKKAEFVDDVLVVWCALAYANEMIVVGWYKNASVFRNLQKVTIENPDGTEYQQSYNVVAKADDCILLPATGIRRRWSVPTVSKKGYGFYKSFLWYPTKENVKEYIRNLVQKIENYDGENWLDRYPESYD